MSYRDLGRPGLLSARRAPGSWTANDEDTAVPSSSEVWAKKFGHSLGIRNCCPVCRALIYEAPIRDNAYKMELSDAVHEGSVEPSASHAPEKLYDWDGVVFATD
ncbi:hypothetical protein C8J57DRAFT_1230414 [Mycena rebaudengoi]|nr:hypothetical protein C8J57DRAFT_1230414 [Mycena rebaudengoi]